jgi:multiple sugar transport system ATP-binding protein
MARLELIGVSKRYGATAALHPTTLSVSDGEFLVLLGPSGCGKSTLLRIVAGLLDPTAGELLLDGERINHATPRERDVALVFQNYALYPHKTVAANLAFPLEVQRRSKDEIAAKVRETAELLGIEGLLARKPSELSGGQMQRVALGRALVRSPRLFLFDEPLSNLDAQTRADMRREIAQLHARHRITTLYVTHDQVEAMTLGDRVAVFERGVLQQLGAPLEVFHRPATTFVATFLGAPPMNLVPVSVVGGRYEFGALSLPGAPVDQGQVVLGVRPHHIELLDPQPGALPARVERIERLGGQSTLTLACGANTLVAQVRGDATFAPGDATALRWPPCEVHWFDARDGRRLPAAP